MRIRLFFSVLFIFFTINVFIAGAQDLALITDEFWNMMIEREQNRNSLEKLKNSISEHIPVISSGSVRIEGRKIKRIIIGSGNISNTDYIINMAADSQADIIIMSPLLSGIVNEVSKQLPDMFFVATADVEVENFNNVSVFKADYSEAYYKAGVWAAEQDSDVYAVFYTGSDRLSRAEESFRDGWGSLKEPQKLAITTFNSVDMVTAEFIDRFINTVQGEKMVAAVFAGPHNESFMNRFDGTPALLLSEYMQNWSKSSYNMAGSIELPAVDFLADIVKSVNTGTYITGGDVKADFFLYQSQ